MLNGQFILQGTVKSVGEVEQVSEKFSKRILVIYNEYPKKDGGVFTKHQAIEFSGNAMSMLDSVMIGQKLDIQCEVESREYNGRWFTALKPGYPIENAIKVVGEGEPQQQQMVDAGAAVVNTPVDDDDSLPF